MYYFRLTIFSICSWYSSYFWFSKFSILSRLSTIITLFITIITLITFIKYILTIYRRLPCIHCWFSLIKPIMLWACTYLRWIIFFILICLIWWIIIKYIIIYIMLWLIIRCIYIVYWRRCTSMNAITILIITSWHSIYRVKTIMLIIIILFINNCLNRSF